MKLIIFAAILAVACAGNSPYYYNYQAPTKAVPLTNYQQSLPTTYYKRLPYAGDYFYRSPDGRTTPQTYGNTQTVKGAYSFIAPNGALAETQYIADQYGYRARSSQTLPGYRSYYQTAPWIKEQSPPRAEYRPVDHGYYYGQPQIIVN